MSNTSSRSSKTCYRFDFPTKASAKEFLEFARKLEGTTNVQHPYDIQQRVKPKSTSVLVTGTGSLIYDVHLLDTLLKKAGELGGYYLPKA